MGENDQRDRTLDVWMELFQAMRHLHVLHDGERPWVSLNLSMAQLKTLIIIGQTGGLPSSRLGDKMGVGPSAVTPVVDKLEEHKLVRRDADPDDRRITWIRPTPKATALLDKLQETNRNLMKRVLDEVPARDLERLEQSFKIISDAVHKLVRRQQESK
jgi:DNA-binding MarR family transcriptional regulator